MKEAFDNSALADFGRTGAALFRSAYWRVRCIFGWHEWKTYHTLSLLPNNNKLYDACIHCGYERRGSQRVVTPDRSTLGDVS